MNIATIQAIVAVGSIITTLVIIGIAIWNAWNQHLQTQRQNKRIIELLEEIRDTIKGDKI